MIDPELLIRSFETDDQESARRLILEGLGEHFGFIDETLNPDLDDITAYYIAPGHAFLVALSGNTLVGTGALVIEGECIGQIVRVSVHRAYRRRGIGKALVERLIELARQHQLKRLQIKTNNDWYEAIGLYKRLGFVEYQRSARGVYMTLEVGS